MSPPSPKLTITPPSSPSSAIYDIYPVFKIQTGESFTNEKEENKYWSISRAVLGPTDNAKEEVVLLEATVEDKVVLLATMDPVLLPKAHIGFVCEKPFSISHNWKNGTVHLSACHHDQRRNNVGNDDDEKMEEETDGECLEHTCICCHKTFKAEDVNVFG